MTHVVQYPFGRIDREALVETLNALVIARELLRESATLPMTRSRWGP